MVVPEVAVASWMAPEVAVASRLAPLPVVSSLGPLEASWGYRVVASLGRLSVAAMEVAAATPFGGKGGGFGPVTTAAVVPGGGFPSWDGLEASSMRVKAGRGLWACGSLCLTLLSEPTRN